MATDEPPYLNVGTDVSAKYKGAFCEAKIKKANRVVKCKVTFKNNFGTFMVTDDQIKGTLRVGGEVEVKHPDKGQYMDAVINKLQDYSQYTVVFDDGDETTLRRTSLCLKSGRHFAESPTLDQFPLTNPEHFSSPVIGTSKFKRKRRSTMNSSMDLESSDDESVPRKLKVIREREHNPDLGRVVCVDFGDRRKKENWYPGIIMPHLSNSTHKLLKDEHLVRSFKDSKYYQVPKRDIREFNRESIQKVDNNALRSAVEKAVIFLEKDELPPQWEKALFAGLEAHSADEDSRDSDSDTSDDEPSEEKDRFVAQLYKFMDERGTPINKAPLVSNRDLNLYKLFKIMHKLGGYNKVTNKNKWKVVYCKMGLPTSNANGPNQIKFAYKRFLQSFEDFYRKLGCTMVSNSRSTRGRHRSDRNFIVTRTRESPKGRKNSKEPKEKAPVEKKVEEKLKVTEKEQEEKKRPEEEKRKKEEKPRLVRSQSLTKEKKEVVEKARTREDARKEKNESPEKKGTRSSSKKEEPAKKEEPPKKPSPKKEEVKAKPAKEEKRKPPPKEEKREKKEEVPQKKEELRKLEEKSPKRKMERMSKERKETRSEEKPPPPIMEVEPPKEEKVEEKNEEEGVQERMEEAEEGKEDEADKRTPPGRPRGEENEEPPNKGKRRCPKSDDKDDKDSMCGTSDSDDGSYEVDADREVDVGDRVKVKYGRGRLQKVYEAKVLKIEPDGTDKRFYVHYAGWNTRYDEWVRKNYIVANVSGKQKDKSSSPTSVKKTDRPPGIPRPDRKNSTGSLRATRSEKKSPLCRGLEPKRRSRRKSETDGGTSDEDSRTAPPFKEELFSDDEEKEKLEDVKRGDITELEKALCVEDSIPKVEPLSEEIEVKQEEEPKETNLSVTSSNSASACSGRFVSCETESALSFAGLIKKPFVPLVEGEKVAAFECKSSLANDPNSESEEKFDSKSISTLFDSILKQPPENVSDPESSKAKAEDSERENPCSLESSKNATSESKAESPEQSIDCKPKDDFDVLLQQNGSPKGSDSKDDVFSFTFSPHNASKDISDQPFGPSTDSLYRKPSETVDVSKMIPGILERLKKDVVSDSPPPPKEELNFDFLSQSVSKCLSRSDSSNSLRICESDDSNLESKDSLVSDRVEVSLDAASISHEEKCKDFETASDHNLDVQFPTQEEKDTQEEHDAVPDSEEAPVPEEEVLPVVTEKEEEPPDVQEELPTLSEESWVPKEEEEEEEEERCLDSESPSLDDLSAAAAMSSEPSLSVADPRVAEVEASVVKVEEPVVEEVNQSSIVQQSTAELEVKEEEEKEKEDEVLEEEEEACDLDTTLTAEEEDEKPATELPEDAAFPPNRKEIKKKKLGKKVGKKFLGSENFEKAKESKLKSRKRIKIGDWDKTKDLKCKSKKLKKSKNKKRFLRHEEHFGDHAKKSDDDRRDSDKSKRREKKRSDKKFLKGGPKSEDVPGSELTKKKKSKKNRGDRKDSKTKKKRKSHFEDDTDSDGESLCKKRKRKKFKVKDCSSSDEAPFREKDSDDPDMSFLLCEEKVPASEDTSSSDGRPAYPGGSGAVLDNTPPTTPSSTESLLSSSPTRESTQSEHLYRMMASRGSEEFRAAATLAFAVCVSPVKRPSPSKRKSKSTYPRVAKVDTYCEEDSSSSPPRLSSSPSFSNRPPEGSSRCSYVPLHEKDPEKRISVLQDKMAALRKRYMALRAEVIAIDHKRRKARKKVREAAGIGANPCVGAEEGPSCS